MFKPPHAPLEHPHEDRIVPLSQEHIVASLHESALRVQQWAQIADAKDVQQDVIKILHWCQAPDMLHENLSKYQQDLETDIQTVGQAMVERLTKCQGWLHSQTKNLFLVADKIGEHVHQVQLLELSESIPTLITAKGLFDFELGLANHESILRQAMTAKCERIRSAVKPNSKVHRSTMWETFNRKANPYPYTEHEILVAARISTLLRSAEFYASWHNQLKSCIDDK